MFWPKDLDVVQVAARCAPFRLCVPGEGGALGDSGLRTPGKVRKRTWGR